VYICDRNSLLDKFRTNSDHGISLLIARLGSLSNYKLMLQGGDPTVKLTPFWSGVAGIGAGVTVSFIAAPIEHVKARLQVQYDAKTKLYAGPIDCARQLVKDN
jgi:solute carrier family 25 carnitine/acylcarnitine transporter 20/29